MVFDIVAEFSQVAKMDGLRFSDIPSLHFLGVSTSFYLGQSTDFRGIANWCSQRSCRGFRVQLLQLLVQFGTRPRCQRDRYQGCHLLSLSAKNCVFVGVALFAIGLEFDWLHSIGGACQLTSYHHADVPA